ncbi:MAG TPA: SIMPL domain-containing protein [Vicinamibacterales bacterium]|nr:SIMPL domain-containing protein [Vicinamibacterales bacterium]
MSRALSTVAFPVLLVVSSVPTAAQTFPPEPTAVVAQAEATLRKAPDLARLTVATEVRDGKAAEARRKSAEAMTAVQAAINAVGLAPDAIQTSGFSLTPEMEYSGGKPSVRNYVVRNQIDVRVDDLDKLADVIDAANSPKNVAITVGSPRFELKAREAAELEAVGAAVRTARARAQAMAAGAGQTLGPVLKIQQGQVYVTSTAPPPSTFRTGMPLGAGARAGAGDASMTEPVRTETPITPGELEIHAQVTLTISIK